MICIYAREGKKKLGFCLFLWPIVGTALCSFELADIGFPSGMSQTWYVLISDVSFLESLSVCRADMKLATYHREMQEYVVTIGSNVLFPNTIIIYI